jgi:histidyl-tRNA synthetase
MTDVYIVWTGESALVAGIRMARELRRARLRVELAPVEVRFRKALARADQIGARFALILGEDEMASGQWTVKKLADGSQTKMSEAELLEMLRKSKPLSS